MRRPPYLDLILMANLDYSFEAVEALCYNRWDEHRVEAVQAEDPDCLVGVVVVVAIEVDPVDLWEIDLDESILVVGYYYYYFYSNLMGIVRHRPPYIGSNPYF